ELGWRDVEAREAVAEVDEVQLGVTLTLRGNGIQDAIAIEIPDREAEARIGCVRERVRGSVEDAGAVVDEELLAHTTVEGRHDDVVQTIAVDIRALGRVVVG